RHDRRPTPVDAASGKLARRPELARALLSANRAGDQLVVTKLDRRGRSLEHLIEISKQLELTAADFFERVGRGGALAAALGGQAGAQLECPELLVGQRLARERVVLAAGDGHIVAQSS